MYARLGRGTDPSAVELVMVMMMVMVMLLLPCSPNARLLWRIRRREGRGSTAERERDRNCAHLDMGVRSTVESARTYRQSDHGKALHALSSPLAGSTALTDITKAGHGRRLNAYTGRLPQKFRQLAHPLY